MEYTVLHTSWGGVDCDSEVGTVRGRGARQSEPTRGGVLLRDRLLESSLSLESSPSSSTTEMRALFGPAHRTTQGLMPSKTRLTLVYVTNPV